MNEAYHDDDLISRREAARRSNRKESEIRQWTQDGRLPVYDVGGPWTKVKWGEVREVIQGLDLNMSRRELQELPPKEVLNLTEAKRRHEFWKGEEKRLEVTRKRGELIPRALADNFVAELVLTFKEGVYSAQHRMAPQVDLKTVKLMRKEFDKVINSIGDAGKKLAEKIQSAIEDQS